MEPPRAGLEPPRHDPRAPAGPPPGGAIALALPPAARGVLANNDSVKTEGLQGLVTVEYRMLVPSRRAGAIFGSRGGLSGFLKEVRARTGAVVNLFEEDKNASDRVLQVMSTEDVQEQRCAAFDGAMDCVNALLHDTASDPMGVACIVLQQGQVGAVMGKAGSTIKELRNVSGCSIHLSAYPDVPRCVKKGEEVMELRGPRDAVMLASHIAFVAIRGNMARGQLIYKHPIPAGAPPPTRIVMGGPPPGIAGPPLGDMRGGPAAGPPPDMYGAPPPGYGAPPAAPLARGAPPPDPRIAGSSRGSRWDTDAPRPDPRPPASAPPPGAAPAPVAPQAAGPPPAVAPPAGVPPPGTQVVYLDPNNPNAPQQYSAAPPQQVIQQAPQVQYVQGPPPLPGQPQVIYVQGPPPGVVQPQVQYIDAATGQPIQYVQTARPGQVQVVQQGAPPAAAPASQPTAVYTSSTGQQVQYVTDPNQPQPTQVTYVYAQPPTALPQVAAAPTAASAPAAAPVSTGASGPGSTSGYGGLAGLVGLAGATAQAPPAAAAPAPAVAPAPAPAPVPVPAPAPTPKARVLLTQEQVVRLRLDDPAQCRQLGALSGATITLSDNVLENGAREVLLAGSDQQCNTAKNLMEALMRSG